MHHPRTLKLIAARPIVLGIRVLASAADYSVTLPMIDSTSSSHRTPQFEAFTSGGASAPRRWGTRADHVAGRGLASRRGEIARGPVIRSAMVERARILAADPNYPPPSIQQALARLILASPNISGLDA